MMTVPEPDGTVWRTSSYSSHGDACVEVATAPDAVLIRDSKHRTGPALSISTPAWHAFLTTVTR
jgi:Domain of unknown function (DUF397)